MTKRSRLRQRLATYRIFVLLTMTGMALFSWELYEGWEEFGRATVAVLSALDSACAVCLIFNIAFMRHCHREIRRLY